MRAEDCADVRAVIAPMVHELVEHHPARDEERRVGRVAAARIAKHAIRIELALREQLLDAVLHVPQVASDLIE